MKTMYCVEVIFKAGGGARIALNKVTWDVWSSRCAHPSNNAFAKGSVLTGLDSGTNPVCLRLKDISAIQFTELKQQINISVKEKNPLNRDDYYDNPCS